MKKQLLLLLVVGTGISVLAQTSNPADLRQMSKYDKYVVEPSTSAYTMPKGPAITNPNLSVQGVTSFSIGTAGNIFTVLENKQYVWADPRINTVVFSHRKRVGTGTNAVGFLTYDVSKNGGTVGTWTVNTSTVYDPSFAPQTAYGARFPQCGIYNPPGNTVADSAYFTYYAPTLDNSNPGPTMTGNSWGGAAWGGERFSGSAASQVDTTSNKNPSTSNCWFVIPESFTTTKDGVTHALEQNSKGNSSGWFYNDTMLYSRGHWNTTTKHYDYQRTFLRIPLSTAGGGNSSKRFVDSKISYADNGMDGYISIIGHNNYTARPDSSYYLIVYKTTDGGDSWTGPTNIMMDGAIAAFPAPTGGAAQKYSAAFEHDAVVDSAGNLHIVVGIAEWALTQAGLGWSIATAPGRWGIFDVYTTDGGTAWMGRLLDFPQFFRGTFGTGTTSGAANPQVSFESRPQASRSWDGDKVIFSWFVTDTVLNFSLAGTANGKNVYPDLWTCGFDINAKLWSSTVNQTGGFNANAGKIYFGNSSYYVFNNAGKYNLPVVFANFSTGTSAHPTDTDVEFKYLDSVNIEGFNITDNSFALYTGGTGIKETVKSNLTVSQNTPNPFSATTIINVNLVSTENVSLEICNSIGQLVASQSAKSLAPGNHQFSVDGKTFGKGIYFYTVKTGSESVTKKMIVQ